MSPQSQSKTYKVESSLDKLTITIVNPINYFKITRLGVWILWGVGAIYFLFILSIQILYSTLTNFEPEKISPGTIFIWLFCLVMIVGFIQWIIQMGYGIYFFLWEIVGKEIIEVTSWSIKIHNKIFGIAKTKEYCTDSISGLQVVPVTLRTFAFTKFRFTRFRVPITGPIMFTHNGNLIRLGLGLTEDDGKAIIGMIQSHFLEFNV